MNIKSLLQKTIWSNRMGHVVILRATKARESNCIEASWDDINYHLEQNGIEALDDLDIDSAIICRANMLGKPGQVVSIYKLTNKGEWFCTGTTQDSDYSFEKEFRDGHH